MITRRRFLSLSLGSAMGAAIGSSLLGCGGGKRAAKPAPAPTPAAPAPTAAPSRLAERVILVYLAGGPSQIDTFDPKPGAANADGVGAISTAVPGLALSEFLPGLAAAADKLAVIRSISSAEGNHQRARHLMHTGYAPAGGVDHPAFGSILAAEQGAGSLPDYIAIGGPGAGAGFLGAAHGPFVVNNPQQKVRNLAPPAFVDDARLARRVTLWRALEDGFARRHPSEVVKNQRAVAERALTMMTASERVAFDLDGEPAALVKGYGDNRLGLGCLMARRLLEAGVKFVEVNHSGWDTHEDNRKRVAALAADLDRSLSALIADLEARGMLSSTLILCVGDFGRTPLLNGKGGRDHYPAVTPALMAGGGVKGGQVIGQTDDRGVDIVGSKLTVPDLFASVAHAVGLDAGKVRYSPAGRPLSTVDDGTVIPGLFG